MLRRWLAIGTVSYILCLLVVFPLILLIPAENTFVGDAGGYSQVADNLLRHGFYSIDGLHPFTDREPGQSVFLAAVYAVFGVENSVGIFAAHSLMLFVASLCFFTVLARRAGERAAGIGFFLLISSGSVLHAVFSAYRETLALSLLLLLATMYLLQEENYARWKMVVMGVLLGLLILTYYPFIFLPLILVALQWRNPVFRRSIITAGILCYFLVSFWALRNFAYDGHFRVIDNRRGAVMWYVRGEQAEQIRGLEPLRCLYAEYISRNWSRRSPVCSFNSLMHQRWPNGFDLQSDDYSEAGKSGQVKILRYLPWYLWFSVFEILELHLPYVGGGWSHAFNLYALSTAAVLYLGCVLGLRALFDRRYRLLLILMIYSVLAYILTDATPRYLVPVLFCYSALAGIGYDVLLRKLPPLAPRP